MAQNIERELQEQISRLPNDQQRRVLDFARSLASLPQSNGGSGEALLRHAGTIEQDDLAIMEQAIADMEQAIAEGCETANADRPFETLQFV